MQASASPSGMEPFMRFFGRRFLSALHCAFLGAQEAMRNKPVSSRSLHSGVGDQKGAKGGFQAVPSAVTKSPFPRLLPVYSAKILRAHLR